MDNFTPNHMNAVYKLCSEHFELSQVKYMQGIMSRLVNSVIYEKVLYCGLQDCEEKLKEIVRLFFRVKIHHALRKTDVSSVLENGKKRNRKVLKLMNL